MIHPLLQYDALVRTTLAWGAGWCVGAIMLAPETFGLVAERGGLLLPLRMLLASAAAFGAPTFIAARRSGWRWPTIHALIWFIGFTVAGIVVIEYLRPHAPAPGALNINTTETMRARQASFGRWGVAPEVVSAYIFTITVIAAAPFSTAFLSALIATGAIMARVGRAALFGVAAAMAILGGVALMLFGTYAFTLAMSVTGIAAALHLSPLAHGFILAVLLAGCCAGAAIELARNLLINLVARPRQDAAVAR